MAADGSVAVAWTEGTVETRIMLRRAGAAGLNLDAARAANSFIGGIGAIVPTLRFDDQGVLWMTYSQGIGAAQGFNLAVVDRSCDGGTTWSGPVAVLPPGKPEGSMMSALVVERPARIHVFGHSDDVQSKDYGDAHLFMHPLE